MRAWLSVLLVICAGPVFAQHGPRVPIEDTGATVEHPGGWTLMPASGSPPVVIFTLCDTEVTDGCLVRGEVTLSAPSEARSQDSLEARLAAANASQQTGLPEPKAVKAGRYDAVESFWQGQHSSHISRIVKRGFMQIQTPMGWYDCTLTTAPDLFETQVEQWRRFCASLDATATTD